MAYKWILLLWCPLLAAGADSQRYIVELSGDPVAEHVAKESKRTGKRAAMDGEVARTRRQQLRDERKPVQTALEGLGVKILDHTETVSNTLIVTMPDSLAERVAALPGVKRVRKARSFKTNLDHALPLHNVPQAWAAIGGIANAGLGIKIGMIDSGIDITHPGMQDSTLQVPAGFPKVNADSDTAFTNSKVIVARSYANLFVSDEADLSAQDVNGHGTGTAMAAAGAQNTGPFGTIVGVAPKAWLGAYKVIGSNGRGSDDVILKAVDDAVADGMDVISMSISSSIAAPRLEDDFFADAFQKVIAAGVIAVVSAGNKGEPNSIDSPGTLASVITVGASFNDRVFWPGSVTVAGGQPIGAELGDQENSSTPPVSGPLFDVSTLDQDGQACLPFPTGSLTGKIAFIIRGECTFETKLNDVARAGAIGALLYTTPDRSLPPGMAVGTATLPGVIIENAAGVSIKKQLAAAPSLTATLNFAITSIPATSDAVADFSSRGPSVDAAIKPDLVAVGSDFYTATETQDPTGELYDKSGYVIVDGTSYSAPLVAGAAALVKGAKPGLTVDQYRSLLINTAGPITARVQEAGAGLLNVQAAVTSTFAVAPTALSFLTGGANPNLSKTLTISNVGASAESYSLAVAPRDTGAAAPTLGVSTLTIQPGQSAKVPLNFTASNLTAGPYEGFVTIRGSQSGILERAPYWYAVPSTTPANITVLYVKGISDFDPSQSNYPYKAGQRINDAIYFRVTDASGLVIPDAQATVTATQNGGSVISTVSRDSLWPGMFSVTVRLGPKAGTNVFRITVGDLAPFDIGIEGK